MGSVPSAEGRWPADVTAVEREGAGGPAVSCGALVWRFQRALRVTVLAKATFDLVHEQPMRWRAPDPIARRDAHAADDPARSLRVATDVVPYRPRADVTFVGFAYAPPNGATATTVRLAVYRETKIVERSLHVYGDRDPSGAVRPFQRMELTYERAGASPENPVLIETMRRLAH